MTPHFTLAEMTFSTEAIRRGIPNAPGERELANLRRLAEEVLEPLRRIVDSPVILTSCYRSPQVNSITKGAKNSEHISGRAADLVVVGLTPMQVCEIIKDRSNILYNQLIFEFGRWCHVSIPELGMPVKMEVLTAKKDLDGETYYLKGLVS